MTTTRRRVSSEGLEAIRVANERRFLRDAASRFGTRFSYAGMQYRRQKLPIQLRCPDHGAFRQTPDKHLRSVTGCPRCGVAVRSAARLTAGERRFRRAVQRRFAGCFSLESPYLDARSPITINCRTHEATFQTTPDRLLGQTHGCPACWSEVQRSPKMSPAVFAARVAKRYDGFVVADAATFEGVEGRVSALCATHGPFIAEARVLLYSSELGCPTCSLARMGYAGDRLARLEADPDSPSRVTTIALMRVEVFGISSLKLGITYRPLLARYREALRVIHVETRLRELDALRFEQHLHASFEHVRDDRIRKAGMRAGKRWGGDTECYSLSALDAMRTALGDLVAALEAGDRDYWTQVPLLRRPSVVPQPVRKVPGVYNPPRPVLCVSTGQRFPSATAAAAALGLSQSNISKVCAGQRPHTRGLAFQYESD